MPLLPADFIQPSLQINLRIILDSTIELLKAKNIYGLHKRFYLY